MCSFLPISRIFSGPFTFSPRMDISLLPFSSQNVRVSRYSCSPLMCMDTFLISTSFGKMKVSLSLILSPSWMDVVPLLKLNLSEHIVSMVVHSTLVITTSLKVDSCSNFSIPCVFIDSNIGQVEVFTTARWLEGAPNILISSRSSLTAFW